MLLNCFMPFSLHYTFRLLFLPNEKFYLRIYIKISTKPLTKMYRTSTQNLLQPFPFSCQVMPSFPNIQSKTLMSHNCERATVRSTVRNRQRHNYKVVVLSHVTYQKKKVILVHDPTHTSGGAHIVDALARRSG